jgi:hypothetical protein
VAVVRTPRDLVSFTLGVTQSQADIDTCLGPNTYPMKWNYLHYAGMLFGHWSVPNLYRNMWVGEDLDMSAVYNIAENPLQPSLCSYGCLFVNVTTMARLGSLCPCEPRRCTVCEYETQKSGLQEKTSQLPEMSLSANANRANNASSPLVTCPGRHMIHAFLVCDTRAACLQAQNNLLCPLSKDMSKSEMSVTCLRNTSNRSSRPERCVDLAICASVCLQGRQEVHPLHAGV